MSRPHRNSIRTPTAPSCLLAQDLNGWGSLCRLSSALLTRPKLAADGYLPFDVLEQNNTGLLCLAGGGQGVLARWIQDDSQAFAREYLQGLRKIFPNRLYIALERTGKADHLLTSPPR